VLLPVVLKIQPNHTSKPKTKPKTQNQNTKKKTKQPPKPHNTKLLET
jgi:hypothetical protein